MFKLNRRSFMQASAMAGIGLTTRQAFSAPRITARLTHTYADGHPITIAATRFADKVKEQSNGDIVLNIFPNSQLGDEVQIAESMRLGSIDGAYLTSPVLTGYIPELQVLDLPFMMRDNQHALKVAAAVNEKLGGFFPAQGYHLLSLIPNGGRDPFGSFAINTPEDVKGRKIRVIQAPLPVALWNLLGANPTPLPAPELYAALQTKLVDFAENTKINYEAFRFFEVAQQFTELNHQYSFVVLIFSEDWWGRLTDDDKTMMQAAAVSLMPDVAQLVFDNEEGALARTVKQGVTVTKVSDKKPWQDIARPLWDQYAQTVPTLQPLIGDIQGIN